MISRFLAAAALVLLGSALAAQAARVVPEEQQQSRLLLQARPKALNCTKVNAHCSKCRNQRITGTRNSELVCTTCASGYKLRRDGISKTCDCAPGLAMDANKNCIQCSVGKYCLGGDATLNPQNKELDCPKGLQTTFAGAKSQAQCFTKPGYGRTSRTGSDGKVYVSGALCEAGRYNVGSNTAGCQKCGAGLTTATNGSTSAAACMAPPGSYLDNSSGKKCQKGTFSTDFNLNSTCDACPDGITTIGDGSTSAAACSLAQKGFYINPDNATEALECPPDTYQDQEAAVTACTPCPNSWRTQEAGAIGDAACLAPPGFELKDGATNITACAVGSYKADWNRNPCVACGTGLITSEAGAISKDACLIPAGWGLTSAAPMVAAPCEKNTYGEAEDRVAAANARCTPCPARMFTLDTIEDRTRNENEYYTSEAACLVKPGWGTTSTTPEECPVGTFNEGRNRSPCHHCGSGWTTVAAGRTSESQCVVQPGWMLDAKNALVPCERGTYSTGGSEGSPGGTCVPCAAGFTTEEAEAMSAEACTLCLPGHGGANCRPCGYGSYAFGGARAGDECSPCAPGSTSKRGASQSQQCYANLIDAGADVFGIADESQWLEHPAATGVGCGAACANSATCVMFKFIVNEAGEGSGKCSLLNEVTTDPSHTVGFKIGAGDDYSVWGVNQAVGVALMDQPSNIADETACKDACNARSECEVYVWQRTVNGGACTLAMSEMKAFTIGMFHVRGDHLFSNRQP